MNGADVGAGADEASEPSRLQTASRGVQNPAREHAARTTRGREFVDRTFPSEDLRDGARLLALARSSLTAGHMSGDANRREREPETAAPEQVTRLVRMKRWSGTT